MAAGILMVAATLLGNLNKTMLPERTLPLRFQVPTKMVACFVVEYSGSLYNMINQSLQAELNRTSALAQPEQSHE